MRHRGALGLGALVAIVVTTALPAAADTTSATPTAMLDCSSALGGAPPPQSERIGGRVALVTSRSRDQANQAAPTTSVPGFRYFAKSPLSVRSGSSPVRIVIPRAERGRVAVSWGNTDHDGIATQVFEIGRCTGHPSWTAFPGGYFVTEPHCVTLVVHVGDRTERRRVGIGKACPGQRPPPP